LVKSIDSKVNLCKVFLRVDNEVCVAITYLDNGGFMPKGKKKSAKPLDQITADDELEREMATLS